MLAGYAHKQKKMRLTAAAGILTPLAVLYLWKRHCLYVFPSAAVTKHAMTVANYRGVLAEKTGEDIRTILTGLIRYMVQGKEFYAFLAFLAVALVFVVLADKKQAAGSLKKCLYIPAVYLLYGLGMFGMYVFSMPLAEAIGLGSAERYRKSIFSFFFVLVAAVVLSQLPKLEKKWEQALGLLCMTGVLGISWLFCSEGFTIFDRGDVEERIWMQEAIAECGIPSGSEYAALIPERDSGYANFVLSYLLSVPEVDISMIDDEQQMENLRGIPYVFVYDRDNPVIEKWISENYPSQLGKPVLKMWE